MRGLGLASYAIAFLCLGCGDGTVRLIDNDNNTPDTIVLEGDLRDINPQVAGANTVVFVYTDLEDPGTFTVFAKQRSVAVPSTSDPMEFRVTQVESGDLTVVFLQDHVGDPDGTINPGDPYAILDDPENILANARNGEVIRVSGVDIDFQTLTADAVSIRSVRDTGQSP